MDESPEVEQRPETPDWFFGFVRRHTARCHGARWPSMAGGMPSQEWIDIFGPWVTRFNREGITEEVADRASNDMAEHAYPSPGGKHLDEFMERAAKVKAALAQQGAGPMSRDEAKLRSAGCPECCANGITTRRMLRTYGDSDSVARVSIFCMCPIGEWMARAMSETDPDMYRRFRRLSQYPELWDKGLKHASWPAYPVPRVWPIEPVWVIDTVRFDDSIQSVADLRRAIGNIGRNVSSKKSNPY